MGLRHGIVNQHAVYAVLTGFLGYAAAGGVDGLDAVIERMSLNQAATGIAGKTR